MWYRFPCLLVFDGLHKSKVARGIGKVTARQLDHWVTIGLVDPVKVYEAHAKNDDADDEEKVRRPTRKRDYLFDFEGVCRIRLVSELRQAGIVLRRAAQAVSHVGSFAWDGWLVSRTSETWEVRARLTVKDRAGAQLGLAAIHLPTLRAEVQRLWLKHEPDQFDSTGLKGLEVPFKREFSREVSLMTW